MASLGPNDSPAANWAATRSPAASVVRSTVDSLSRSPAIFRNTRSAPSAKLPSTPAIAEISSAAGVSGCTPSRNKGSKERHPAPQPSRQW